MQTPARRRAGSVKTHSKAEEYDSPAPPSCCIGRLFLLEYGILFGLQLFCLGLDLIIWVVAAYSVIAAFCLIFGLHILLLLPAIFLPLLVHRCAAWLKTLRDWGVFHKYDWNIAVSAITIVSTVVALLLVLLCQPLYFHWTHTTLKVGPNPTYDVAYPYSSFKFDRSFYVNTTMMGEDVSYPVGDPNGSGLFYNCYAPILKNGTHGPNLFWAACPWQKQTCNASLYDATSCVGQWRMSWREGTTWAKDVVYMIKSGLINQGLIWQLPPPPPNFIVVHWEDVNASVHKARTAWWATLLTGNGLILAWFLVRRFFLRFFCTPELNGEYAALN